MVRGLDIFKKHFNEHTDKFVLIGGCACDIVFNEIDLEFRATKDLDIVLILEAVDADFAKVFWSFIKKGEYKNHQKSTGKKQFYRFYEPNVKSYPYMIELFSKVPNALQDNPTAHLTLISFDDAASSLSAILLESAYYNFIKRGRIIINGSSPI
ncbi:MAG: hypothetical protein ABIA04_16140 [Pseudomonadota bacterium]